MIQGSNCKKETAARFIAARECSGRVLLETLDHMQEWVKTGRMLVISTCSPDVRRTTRATDWCLKLANELVIPYVAADSQLAVLLNDKRVT
ncbi:MAG: hypothetical protein PHE55_03990 [Methylococcaceae bacterium]|nr:hypothetical protein [Methylococcaceae bacterium]